MIFHDSLSGVSTPFTGTPSGLVSVTDVNVPSVTLAVTGSVTLIGASPDGVVDTIAAAAGTGYAGDGTRADLFQFLDRFQAAAREVGGRYFAEEITRAITQGTTSPG